jgi:hypothetical protein
MPKIQDLEKQIDELRAKMVAECETVLADSQKQMLAARRKAASEARKSSERRSERRAQAESTAGRPAFRLRSRAKMTRPKSRLSLRESPSFRNTRAGRPRAKGDTFSRSA